MRSEPHWLKYGAWTSGNETSRDRTGLCHYMLGFLFELVCKKLQIVCLWHGSIIFLVPSIYLPQVCIGIGFVPQKLSCHKIMQYISFLLDGHKYSFLLFREVWFLQLSFVDWSLWMTWTCFEHVNIQVSHIN